MHPSPPGPDAQDVAAMRMEEGGSRSEEGDFAGHRDELLFAAITTSRMPMVVTDPHRPDNPIVFANQAFMALTGYEADDVIGRNCRFLQGPATDSASIADVREALRGNVEVATEMVNYRKDGTPFWNALFVSPVFDPQGRLIYHFASQLDVTRRRAAEASLGHAQKMEALGQLTGGIAHDFNNLLQVMLGHLEILDRRLAAATIDAAALAKASRGIRNAVDKAGTVTGQLLAFARKQHLEGRSTSLSAFADHLKGLAQVTLGDAIDVVIDFAPDLDHCRIDPAQFEVALLNILINARDAMQGEGTVTLRASNVVVGADEASPGIEAGRYVSIAVGDTGPGIPAALIHRVMEPFFTTKEEGKGTGLGLSMVYGFVKQSGGAMRIESTVGAGTTVHLCFPSSDERDADGLLETRQVRECGGDETILVVDDRPEVLGIASRLLKELGYRVISAGNGVDATKIVDSLATEAQPALLFSDVIMPGGINGYMLARRFRQKMPRLKVLLTTGFAGEMQQVSPDAGSEFEIIAKPYKLDELARRIRTVLDAPARPG